MRNESCFFSILYVAWCVGIGFKPFIFKMSLIHELYPLMNYISEVIKVHIKCLKEMKGLASKVNQCEVHILIFENPPLVRWFHINVNSIFRSFQINSWFFQPNSFKCATNFMNFFNQFHMWLNLISWIANCSNFMNLLNQFHYMTGPCWWNFILHKTCSLHSNVE